MSNSCRRAVICLLFAGALSCGGPAEQPAARHLLLVTLDTTRADRLGCYGREGAGTPVLDRLAQAGTRVERAYAQSPLTLPSHASILTGLLPPRTGIHVNGQPEMRPGVRTLAELLVEQGFFTAAAVGGFPVSRRFPVSRGFESFDDRMVDPRNPAGLERDAGEVAAAAIAQLDGRGERRLFLWVHFFDPHDPYAPPPPFRERYAGDPYQGEIARVDAALSDLLNGLEQRIGLDRLLVCVVGDHGEALGEHGEPTHGFFVYESTVRVPLIFKGPRVPAGHAPQGPAQTVDILPTLLELLDLPVPGALDGGALDLAGQAISPAGPIYIESELPLRNYGWSPLRGVVDGWRKYIQAPEAELYDLRVDPEEIENLAAAEPEDVSALDAWVAALSASDQEGDAGNSPVDPRLVSLGYVGSGSTGDGSADPKDRLETYLRFLSANRFLEAGRPEEALPLLERLVAEDGSAGARFKRAQAWRMSGRLQEAEAEFIALEGERALTAEIALERARIALWTERPALALNKLQIYLAGAPTDAEALMFRGASREMLGDMAGAESDYLRALEINPAFHGASLRLGALLLVTGRMAEARSHLTTHLERYPGDDIARGLLESMGSGLR